MIKMQKYGEKNKKRQAFCLKKKGFSFKCQGAIKGAGFGSKHKNPKGKKCRYIGTRRLRQKGQVRHNQKSNSCQLHPEPRVGGILGLEREVNIAQLTTTVLGRGVTIYDVLC